MHKYFLAVLLATFISLTPTACLAAAGVQPQALSGPIPNPKPPPPPPLDPYAAPARGTSPLSLALQILLGL